MNTDFVKFNESQVEDRKVICDELLKIIDGEMSEAESKVWHGSPVWFLEGNPVVGYDVLKDCVRVLFWSGQTFDEPGLAKEGSFKAAEIRYTQVDQIKLEDLKRWLQKSKDIQWDYKNIVKRKGVLERIK